MSFLFDPPMLVTAGVLIERAVPEDQRDLAEAATLGVFFSGSFGLYQNVPALNVIWFPFRGDNGRDFMWNSGVFRMDTTKLGWGMHLLAAAMFSTYPFFLKLGRRLGRRVGRRGDLVELR